MCLCTKRLFKCCALKYSGVFLYSKCWVFAVEQLWYFIVSCIDRRLFASVSRESDGSWAVHTVPQFIYPDASITEEGNKMWQKYWCKDLCETPAVITYSSRYFVPLGTHTQNAFCALGWGTLSHMRNLYLIKGIPKPNITIKNKTLAIQP